MLELECLHDRTIFLTAIEKTFIVAINSQKAIALSDIELARSFPAARVRHFCKGRRLIAVAIGFVPFINRSRRRRTAWI